MRRMNAPLPKREAVFTNEAIEKTRGLTVTIWYTIAGVPEVRTGISQGVEEAWGTSMSEGKFRKPENDVIVLQDPHRITAGKPNRAERVGPWSQPKTTPAPEGHQIVSDPSGNRYLYRLVRDEGQEVKPVEYRIPINRITSLSTGSGAVVGGLDKELAEVA